jgi:hypothetical protein
MHRIHPGYMLHGETLEALLDPDRYERGRASPVSAAFSPSHVISPLRCSEHQIWLGYTYSAHKHMSRRAATAGSSVAR